jgi:hypothetical protein
MASGVFIKICGSVASGDTKRVQEQLEDDLKKFLRALNKKYDGDLYAVELCAWEKK